MRITNFKLATTVLILVLCTQKAHCIACDPGTYDNGVSCSNCDTSVCLECLSSPTSCTVCPEGKYLNSNVCSTCPSGCSTCRSNNVCMTCSSGYVLSGANCITEAQAQANPSSTSGLQYGWIIAITAGGAIVVGLVIWALCKYLSKKPVVQRLEDTMVKPPQETIDIFKALFAGQNVNSSSPNTEGTLTNNTMQNESNPLKTSKVDTKNDKKNNKGASDQANPSVNLGALFGGMMSSKQQGDDANAPKAPPPFMKAMGGIPGFGTGKQKDVMVDTQKSRAKAPTAAPSFK
jgi:hypothetical protein